MILPDVNVLVYAFQENADHHDRYAEWLNASLASEDLLLPDAVLAGFLRVTTNVRLLSAVATDAAMRFVVALRAAPRSRHVEGSNVVWDRLITLCADDPGIRGGVVFDAYLAATALAHDARLATRDRGFGRYPGLRWFDPARTRR